MFSSRSCGKAPVRDGAARSQRRRPVSTLLALALAAASATTMVAAATPALADPTDQILTVAWGHNEQGQLGDGTTQQANTPVTVAGQIAFTKVEAGTSHTLAIAADSTIWSWGTNGFGGLGDGTTTPSRTPVHVPGLTDIIDVSAGAGSSFAIDSSGRLWAWGFNGSGFGNLGLGDNVPATNPVPKQVLGLPPMADVETSQRSVVARDVNGEVWTWGSNSDGQLGNGTVGGFRATPAKLAGLTTIIDVAAADFDGLALRADGTVFGWGDNGVSQLGPGGPGDRPTPGFTAGIAGLTQIGIGSGNVSALRNDGTVWSWGINSRGELGIGTISTPVYPPVATAVSGATQLAVGAVNGYARRGDGTVLAWGDNTLGSLGTGSTAPNNPNPSPVFGVSHATYLGSGATALHALAIQAIPTDFSITLDPKLGSVQPGGSTTTVVSLIPSKGFTSTAAVSVTNLPPGVTATLSAPKVSEDHPVTITLHTSIRTPRGQFRILITAAADSITKAAPYTLTIGNITTS